MNKIYRNILSALVVALALPVHITWGAEADKPTAEPATAASPAAADLLVVEQARIADSYARFKTELLKMAEQLRGADPARAELLEKAAQQMSSSGTEDQLRSILKLLDSELVRDVDQALDKQDKVQTDLTALLTLLLSANRDHKNSSEKQRLREYIKQIEQAIRVQRGIQGQSERNGELPDLSKRQGELADRTEGIAKKIKDNEEAAKPTAEPKDSESKENPDGKPGKPGDDKKSPSNPDGMNPMSPGGESPKTPGQGPAKPGGKSKPKDSEPGEGQPEMGEAAPPDAPPHEEQPNGRKQVEQAVEKMRQAQKRLDEAKRNDATEQQEEAIAALEKARAELEEILRQLREEEIEKTLVKLEARFRIMLKMQQAVLDSTVLLDRKPAAQRDRADEIEAGRLARKEQQIVAEVDKASLLLREDGSAVAFPEAVGQLREDMELITERLIQAKIGTATQRMEQDVVDALKEMIAALEKAQKDLKQKKQQGMSQPGAPADPPLVDSISELKMIRALQVRVNRRTAQYDELVKSGETPAAEMLPRLKKLAEHEERIHRISRDLHTGKNE
ncbi:MAG: hypothetical protein K8T91_03570 [Planctomycetes bacterium]|nr:hypothetical protein [Planctomycetota bacterium]